MNFTNREISGKLKGIAAVLTVKKGNPFQIRAYEGAAEAIEHSTSEIQDLWEEDKLADIPGIGANLQTYLEELFKTGRVKHWEEIEKDVPEGFFEFLTVPGIGPKTADKLTKLGVKNKEDLKTKLESGVLTRRGISQKTAENILKSLNSPLKQSQGRMLLPYAFVQAQKVSDYLQKNPAILAASVLGSLRRMSATIGDLDFAISTNYPAEVADYISKMPGVSQVLGKGEKEVSVINSSGLRLDFLTVGPSSYGALLQHFTGSKQHNIHLRTIAEEKGLSLSEYGVKEVKSGLVKETKTEDEFYSLLEMETPPPEIREDTGEIEAAIRHQLPHLVELKNIKGDFHIHDNFPIEPSHDLGASSLEEIVAEAKKLGYQYVGVSDHSPSVSNHTSDKMVKLIEKRAKWIEEHNYSSKEIRILNLLEVDIQPDGSLSVPDAGLQLLDFAIASIHSVHKMPKDEMTKRIMKALESPYVKVFGHPTGRLLNKRDSYDADWPLIFKFAAEKQIALEINSYPDRLDLPDILVREAKKYGVKFVIDTDSHIALEMDQMVYGVAVARRGWATKEDIINSWDWTTVARWFNIKI